MNAKILIIDDEVKLANTITEGLAAEGYVTRCAYAAEEALAVLETTNFNLLLLDLMLPEMSGLEFLATLRKRKYDGPILILSARDTVAERVQGLQMGADDYLVKPFAFAELLARIHALLRRFNDQVAEPLIAEPLTVGDLTLNPESRSAVRAGIPIHLTLKEYVLLKYLVGHRNTAVTRKMIESDVWNISCRATPMDNIIDVHIAHLRKKIDEPFDRPYLHTLRGIGFMLAEHSAWSQ